MDLKQHFKNEMDKVYEKVNELEESFKKSVTTVTELRNQVSNLETELCYLKKENSHLKRDRDNMLVRMDQAEHVIMVNTSHTNDLEQYTRRNNIRIYGIDDHNKDETAQETTLKVINFCRNTLGLTLERSDINTAHCMGRFQENGDRVIICRFVSRIDRDEVIKRQKQLKGTKCVVREDLTIKNAKLLKTVSEMENVKSARSDQGKIILKLKNYKQNMRVKFTL